MLMPAFLYRYWIRTLFFLLSFSISQFGFTADLLIKEAHLQLHINDANSQRRIEQALVPVISELNAVAQEFEVLNQKGIFPSPSKKAVELLQLCEQWQAQLHNQFSCRLGALQRDWDAAVMRNELPDRALLRQKSRQHLKLQWQLDSEGVRFSDQAVADGLQLDLQGLWQGWVLEQIVVAIERIAQQEKFSPGKFSLAYDGLTTAVTISESFEQQVELKGLSAFSVPLNNQTLAVFDRQQNLRKVAHYPMSRLLVAKEGWPVEFAPSLLVRAKSAIDAGVLVQSLLSDSVNAALKYVNKKTDVTALIITETGLFFASKDWYGDAALSGAPWSQQQIFSVEYEIPALDVAEYRRPYIAIWIADEKGNAIRHLQVLGDNRWVRDLRLWWRKFGRDDDSLVDALAGATRKPGRHRISWDGRNGQGVFVQQGNYVLHLEAVREHGERESIQVPFSLGGQVFPAEEKGAKEIGRVKISLH